MAPISALASGGTQRAPFSASRAAWIERRLMPRRRIAPAQAIRVELR